MYEELVDRVRANSSVYKHLSLFKLCVCRSTDLCLVVCTCQKSYFRALQIQLKNVLMRHLGRRSECTFLNTQKFWTTKVVISCVAADDSNLPIEEEVLGNETLEAHYGMASIRSIASHELSTSAPRCVEHSGIPLYLERSCQAKIGF